jgi:pyruvate/2-oxoglutarate dehydrogenase complex dihydrolipoamide acyltransferase (E2) component
MKFAFLLSGAVGFAIVALTGYNAGRQPDLVLRDAALACLGMAILGRWFWGIVDRSFAHALHARIAAEQAAEAAAAEAAAEAKARAANPPPASTAKSSPAATRPAPAPAPAPARR